MRRIRIVGACVATTLAMSAFAAASASAAPPEFLHGALPPGLLGITGTSVGNIKMINPAVPSEVICTKETLLGEIEFAPIEKNVEEVFITFTGCHMLATVGGKRVKCQVRSQGRPFGTVRTKRLRGELGEVTFAEAPSEVGLDLVPEVGTVLVKAEAPSCGLPPLSVEGSIIGEITAKGLPETLTKTLLSTTVAAKQKIQKFTTGLKDTLEAPGEITLTSTLTLKFGEVVQVT
jgi:hypothetical protein